MKTIQDNKTGAAWSKSIFFLLFFLLPLLMVSCGIAFAAENDPPPVALLGVEGGIGPATTEFIGQGLDEAREKDAQLLMITLDTPGGLMEATRDIVKLILNAPIPVAVFVYPEGSRAASAGTYILYSSHIAAMAPVCTTGAATPIRIGNGPMGFLETGSEAMETGRGGEKVELSREAEEDEAPDAAQRKIIEEAVAYIRELANKRGRNADWAERAVREGISIETSAAREKNVIDFIAQNPEMLLEKLDGHEVQVNEQTRTLMTSGSVVFHIEPSWRTQLLSIITNPNIAYILLLIGIYGLLLEGYNPGAVVPGVAGAISLLLAFYALQILPVNLVGVGLIILGAILMVSEAFVPSFGALGLGGIIALVLGGIFLVDPDIPGFGVDPAFISAVGIAMGLVFLALTAFLVRARQRPLVAGREDLVGAAGRALTDFEDGRGSVFVHGERWRAKSSQPLKKDDPIRVTGIDGLTLIVARGDPD